LTSVTLPSSVTSIGFGAFEGCTGLTSITLPFVGAALDGQANTHFGWVFGAQNADDNSSFIPYALKNVTILGGTWIESGAFMECYNIEIINLPDSVEYIGDGAFYYCESLQKFDMPASLEYIGDYAFEDCFSLTEIIIPAGVLYIGQGAFARCENLLNVIILGTETYIGFGAFVWCDEITDFTLSYLSSADMFGRIFSYRNTGNAYVPAELRAVTVNNVRWYNSYGWHGIYTSAFAGCTGLTDIRILNFEHTGIIGNNAFKDCWDLTNIVLPGNLTGIGDNAFENCYSLQNVFFMGTETQWENIMAGLGQGNWRLYNTAVYIYSEVPPEENVDYDYWLWYFDGDGVPAVWPWP